MNDASRLEANQPAEVIAVSADPAAAERQLSELVREVTAKGGHISISGAHHSMGGHTFYRGGIVLDMLTFNRMSLDEPTRVLTVGSGARWSEVIAYLDHRGYAVSIMQSNNDFSVGGSLSVNCHGWQNDSPPIASTVESFRILTASSEIRRCSRTENQELFSLALGGYGLFGVILEVNLRVVPNEYYVAEAHRVKPADFNRVYHELTRNRADVGLAYGRISVAPSSFLDDAIVTLLRRRPAPGPSSDTLKNIKPSVLKRLVLRGGIGSDYGKNLRWWLEKTMGETGGQLLSRNQIMQEPANLYATRDPRSTDILHEYFIPAARLLEFVEKSRPVFAKHKPELLTITVRAVCRTRTLSLRCVPECAYSARAALSQGAPSPGKWRDALTRELINTSWLGAEIPPTIGSHATTTKFAQANGATEFFG